jgi:hypothetical protein
VPLLPAFSLFGETTFSVKPGWPTGWLWQPVKNLFLDPLFPSGEGSYNKAHFAEYLMFFDPVETRAIRVKGNVGLAGEAAKNPPRFTSVSELAVYGPVPGIEKLRGTSNLE